MCPNPQPLGLFRNLAHETEEATLAAAQPGAPYNPGAQASQDQAGNQSQDSHSIHLPQTPLACHCLPTLQPQKAEACRGLGLSWQPGHPFPGFSLSGSGVHR